MPQSGIDWWVIAGVMATVIGVWIAWRQLRDAKPKTTNIVEHGNRNELKGGDGRTKNKVSHGDDNKLSG